MRFILCFFFITSVFIACDHPSPKVKEPTRMMATRNGDTAIATLHITSETFKGVLEINYNGAYIDSGDVKGRVKGDTLIGDYHFQHYGLRPWKRKPIAFLKKGNRLVMGTGTIQYTWGRIHFDARDSILFPDTNFVFKPL